MENSQYGNSATVESHPISGGGPMLRGASVLGKPLTVWTRGMLEAPFPSTPCGVGLRSDFRETPGK